MGAMSFAQVGLVAAAVPLEVDGPADGGAFVDALWGFGGFLLVIGLVLVGFLLLRRYGLLPDRWGGRGVSPEDSARRVLAERLAAGEVSTEEFLERAGALNWTPGSTVKPARRQPRP